MEVDLRGLTNLSLEVINWLVTAVGPHPAGSPAESLAQTGLAKRFSNWGYDLHVIPACFAPLPSFEPLFSLSAAAYLVCTWLLPVFPWPAFVLPLLALELPEVDSYLERRRKPVQDTQNILALPNRISPDKLNLLLVAHVDTARANPSSRFWRQLEASIFPMMQGIACFLAILGLLHVLRLNLPQALQFISWIGSGMLALVLISLDIWELLLPRPRPYSVGAFDNASGVGVLAGIAWHLSNNKPKNIRVGFLITGAEETGMHGAMYAAKWLKEHNSHPSVLVLDQVGAGEQLCYARQVGRLHPLKTSVRINTVLNKVDPLISPIDYSHKSGDFEAFLLAGFEASSLERSGSLKAKNAYHTQLDRMDIIKPEAVEKTIAAVLDIIETFDKEAR